MTGTIDCTKGTEIEERLVSIYDKLYSSVPYNVMPFLRKKTEYEELLK